MPPNARSNLRRIEEQDHHPHQQQREASALPQEQQSRLDEEGRSHYNKYIKRSSSRLTSTSSSRTHNTNDENVNGAAADEEHDDSLMNSLLPIQAYIPHYLRNVIYPYHGDFCYAKSFQPQLLTQLMAEGFLPIAANARILLPKLHEHRCVIPLQESHPPPPSQEQQHQQTAQQQQEYLHVSKSIRKKSKKFAISCNTAFDQVVMECQHQHGSHSWLHPPLVHALREMFQNRQSNYATVMESSNSTSSSTTTLQVPVRMYSIEVWNVDTNKLVAGELGCSVGSIYTSLTGFTTQDSAGSVQLATLGQWLQVSGFEIWDLGMDMEYKQNMGAKLWPRHLFVKKVHELRSKGHVQLMEQSQSSNCNGASPPQPQRYHARSLIDNHAFVPLPAPNNDMADDDKSEIDQRTPMSRRQAKKARVGTKSKNRARTGA